MRRLLLFMCLLRRSAALNCGSHSGYASCRRIRSDVHRNTSTRHPSAPGSVKKSMRDPSSSGERDEWRGPTGRPGSLERLCSVSLRACRLMTPLILAIYERLAPSGKSDGVKKAKRDSSAFTIADGLVQRLLIRVLFSDVNFRDIVGEEEGEENHGDGREGGCASTEWWFRVQGLTIPSDLRHLVVSARAEMESLATEHLSPGTNGDNDGSECSYRRLTVFIDPIDGTREFSTGMGEQCSVCIGFADGHGRAVGGVVYRPLSRPGPTWAAGAKSERYAACDFGFREGRSPSDTKEMRGGLLTTNGSISPFVGSLIEELKFERVKSGGAGNKMMMLLENSVSSDDARGSMVYIQDRGVSRWDTCAAEACLEAFGGSLIKLTHFVGSRGEEGRLYTYLASQTNLDFIPGSANLTKYNRRTCTGELQPNQRAFDVEQVKPYSNLCGLVALGKEWNTIERRSQVKDAVNRAAMRDPPSFD